MQPVRIPFQVVVVGDSGVGKTSLLLKYTMGSELKLRDFVVPPIHPRSTGAEVTVNGDLYILDLIDTRSSLEENVIGPGGPAFYDQTDTFIICFSLVNPSSFQNVRAKWYPEIVRYFPDATILLVGTHDDLRERLVTITTPIKYEEGEALAKEIGAGNYVECSASTGWGVKTVLEEAVKVKGAPKFEKRTDKNVQLQKRSHSLGCVIL